MDKLFLILLAGGILFLLIKKIWAKPRWKVPNDTFPVEWQIILIEKVGFYNSLSKKEKSKFEYRIHEFILNYRITGIDTDVTTSDKLLIASSAIIPIFAFDNWKYSNLYEILVYPDSFNDKFETAGSDRNILGMVGSGYMEGKMILSKSAIRHSFLNSSDKRNTPIHEFAHLIDKSDGVIDGVPTLLLEKQYAIPWLHLIKEKINEINDNKSDINPYGGTNESEFFAVISEYFFERPKLLKKKHPKSYSLLEEIFDQNLSTKNLNKKYRIGRNSPCPCNSGLKFKDCCGKIHYSDLS